MCQKAATSLPQILDQLSLTNLPVVYNCVLHLPQVLMPFISNYLHTCLIIAWRERHYMVQVNNLWEF